MTSITETLPKVIETFIFTQKTVHQPYYCDSILSDTIILQPHKWPLLANL